MPVCIKRRLLFAASQAYEPEIETMRRTVGWTSRPLVVRREVAFWRRPIDQAIVGTVPEGVVVAFRGSLPPFHGTRHDGWDVLLDWMNGGLSMCRDDPAYDGGVHWGFAESVRRLWLDDGAALGVRSAIQAQLAAGAPRRLFFTGHSKGGALANLAAYRAARRELWRDMPIHAQTIGAVRPGNADFARAYAATRIRCLRYEVAYDMVPHLPPGPTTPQWVRTLVSQVWPGIGSGDYHPVGTRVAPERTAEDWLDEWMGRVRGALGDRGLDLTAFTPSAIAAHAICPHSDYDRLICTGEPGCSPGHHLWDRAKATLGQG